MCRFFNNKSVEGDFGVVELVSVDFGVLTYMAGNDFDLQWFNLCRVMCVQEEKHFASTIFANC